MDELKVEIALEIIQRKIVSLLKSNKDVDVDTAKETLKTLVEEREKIYNLDEETIEKVYNMISYYYTLVWNHTMKGK